MNPVAELQPLLDALLEDAIAPEQLARLEELVLAHPEAAEHYVRVVNLHADMIDHLAGLPAPKLDAAKPTPAPAPMPKKRSRRRWTIGIAACLTLALSAIAAADYIEWRGKKQRVAAAQADVDRSRAEVKRVQEEQQTAEAAAFAALNPARTAEQVLANEYQSALQAARRAIESKEFAVRLTGPTHFEPGATNTWQIETLRHGAVGRPRGLDLVVKDAKDAVLLKQSHDRPVGVASLTLPPGFWEKVKPGSDLFLEVSTRSDDNRTSVLADRIPLARPVYVTHLVTDKPLYQPGEVIRFRSLTLERSTLQPPTRDMHLRFRLRDPVDTALPLGEGNGRLLQDMQAVLGPDGKPLRGIGTGEHFIPATAPGGEYKLDLIEVANGKDVLIETRKFLVNRYVPDRFEKKLEFDGKSYGAGGFVQARVEVTRTAGGPMRDAIANITATVDGRTFHSQAGARFTIAGNVAVLNLGFKLPADLASDNAVLSVMIRDTASVETIVRPIPVVSKSLRVEFFPEGGELVSGVPGRVYFQVRTPSGKPADLRGHITDGTSKVVDVETATDAGNAGVNRGQGAFRFTPKPGASYFLKVSSPSGITEPTANGFPLPAAVADGIALESLDAATAKGSPIRVRLHSNRGSKTLHVGAYARGRLLDHRSVMVQAGVPVEVSLAAEESAGGVTRVTVFESREAMLVPRAERLVYRVPAEQLILGVNPDKPRYSPGEMVKLHLTARNETQAATPAVLLVGVVNRSVIAMADNKTDRLLPTHFLLSGEVKHGSELEHADFLLTDHPQAAAALDRLLGTQGWRRFAEQTGGSTDPADKIEVSRMLEAHGQRPTALVELMKLEEQRVAAEFQPKLDVARIRVLNEQARTKPQTTALTERYVQLTGALAGAELELRTASSDMERFKLRVQSWLDYIGLPVPLLITLAGLIGLAVMGIANATPQRRGAYITCAALASFLVIVLFAMVGGIGRNANSTFQFVGMSITAMDDRGEGAAGSGGFFDDAAPPRMPVATRESYSFVPLPKVASESNEVPAIKLLSLPGKKSSTWTPLADPERLRAISSSSVAPFFVREFAHRRDAALGDIRADFTETLYWHPALVVPNTGTATVQFQLSDDIARYQVLVAGHTTDGRIGATIHTIEARKPFSLDPKLPLEVSHTDVIDMPIRVVNDTDARRSVSFMLAANGLKDGTGVHAPFDLAANATARRIIRLAPDKLAGDATVLVSGTSHAADADTIARSIRIVPDGFPGVGSFSDTLQTRARGSINLPKDVVPGSLRVRLEVYPTSLADLVSGLDGLLREPYGCFEQTSTSNYPNAMILDYLNQSNQVNPAASAKAKGFLDRGYAKLISFECPDTPGRTKHGFEWFGKPDAQHEPLTAYGLLQFKDMSRVHPVDAELIKRTQAFLMSRRDGAGGFKRSGRGLHSWEAPKHVMDAYITWALVESDPDDADLRVEIAALKAAAMKPEETDAYFLALVANILLHRGDREAAHTILDRLQAKHLKDGAVTGARTSVTQSGGRDLLIETTALALLGWMRANDPTYSGSVKAATRWISQQRGGYGGFGSTQSTVLALKALALHAKKFARPAEGGTLQVLVGGRVVATRAFTKDDVEVIGLDIPNPDAAFPPGRSDVEIVTDAKEAYPFALSHTFTTLTPLSAADAPLRLTTSLGKADAIEGDTVPLAVRVENTRKTGTGMAVAIVGLPAGLKPPTDLKQLTALREQDRIAYFEVRGRELVLYWRETAPAQVIDLTLDLVCDVPGEYRGPASRAYPYYESDLKQWVEPLRIRIAARSE